MQLIINQGVLIMTIYSKGFMQLVRDSKYLYIVLLDGWFDSYISAENDDNAIEKFNEYLRDRKGL